MPARFDGVLEGKVKLIMNDRADICIAAGYDGVHVGQDDLSPEGARTVVGPDRMLGVSTHNLEQLKEADARPGGLHRLWAGVSDHGARRIRIQLVGLDGLRAARAATKKPLVAIGGVTRANARSVIDAGADSVAVISDLLSSPQSGRRISAADGVDSCEGSGLTRILRNGSGVGPSTAFGQGGLTPFRMTESQAKRPSNATRFLEHRNENHHHRSHPATASS